MGRTASRRAANSANRRISAAAWFYGQSFNGGTRGDAPKADLLSCAKCGKQVFTLVAGYCSKECRPVEHKNLQDMTTEQYNAVHDCGLPNARHCDGWDGNWLDCDEARRRLGLCAETFSEVEARIVSSILHDVD